MTRIIKDTIHANGIDIGIYTTDFENEFISLTDIAKYKSDDPTAVSIVDLALHFIILSIA